MKNQASLSAVSGVFLESADPKQLADWYAMTFGLQFHYWPERSSYGAEFVYRESTQPAERQSTVFVIRPGSGPRHGGFKVQFQVADVDAALKHVKGKAAAGISSEEYEYGTFAQIRDPDGNTIELYQPM